MVMPRSRSAGRKSVVVLPVSTEPGVERYDDFNRIDSVRVVFPESEPCREPRYNAQAKGDMNTDMGDYCEVTDL